MAFPLAAGSSVAHGRVFAVDEPGGVGMDRGGNVVDEQLPGVPITMSDRYAVFRVGGPAATTSNYSVHRIEIG